MKSILDEYIRRRQGGSAVYNPRQVQYGQGMSYRQPTAPQTKMPENQNGQVTVYRPNQWSKPAMVKAPTTVQPETPALDAVPPTDSGGSNVLTWDDQIDIEIQNAAKKVLEVANRKFQYSTHESPIYSIMRQEYLKEADLAAGRATAAAAQNAGGFGSSFAVMAGEEARRQVMEGFYDQEDELYAAARSEFEVEKASAFDNYLKLREMKAMEKERLMKETPMTMTLEDGTTVEVTDAARELYAGYLDSFTQGTGYDTLKTAMINGGASEADADQAIAMFKKLGGATIADKISAFEKNPTVSDAEGIMADAKESGTWEQVQPKVSAGLSDAYIKALNDLEGGYRLLGYDEETWSGLSEEKKATAILQAGGKAVKSGVMSEADFAKLISKDAKTAVIEIGNSDDRPIAKSRAVFNAISGILVCVENGTLSREAADQIIADMAKNSVVKAAYEKHAKFLNSIFNNIEWKKKLGIEAMPDGFWRLDDAQEEALRVLDRIYKQY